MKRKIGKFALFCLATLLAGTIPAICPASPLEAQITANVNLRQAPGLEGKVITGLDEGQRVTVADQEQNWRLVEVSGDGYGYRGWVYGDYVQVLETAPGPVESLRAAAQKPPAQRPASLEPAEEKPAAAARTLPAEFEKKAVTSKALSREAETSPGPSPIREASAVPPRLAPDSPAAAASPGGNTAVKLPASRTPAGSITGGGSSPFAIALRMATVLFSCTALLFSFRALQLSRKRP